MLGIASDVGLAAVRGVSVAVVSTVDASPARIATVAAAIAVATAAVTVAAVVGARAPRVDTRPVRRAALRSPAARCTARAGRRTCGAAGRPRTAHAGGTVARSVVVRRIAAASERVDEAHEDESPPHTDVF